MAYEFRYQIFPPHIFGLEEPGFAVVPAQEGTPTYGPTIDTKTMNIAGRGSQTRARLLDDQINESMAFGGAQCRLQDDFLTVVFEAPDDESAEKISTDTAADFCAVLSLLTTAPCRFEFVQALEGDAGRRVQTLRSVNLGRFHMYNLDSLRERLSTVPAISSLIDDSRLRPALIYFQKGLFLRDLFGDPKVERYPHYLGGSAIAQEAFLNFWKSIAVILGETKEGKRFQTFYRKLGYSREDFERTIRPVYDVRDRYNIAHSSLDPSKEFIDINQVAMCLNLAKEVIERYISFLETQRNV